MKLLPAPSGRPAEPPGRARALMVCAFTALVAYAVSSPEPAGQAAAILIGALALPLTSPLVGLRIPRWVAGLGTLAVLLYTLNRALSGGLGVHDFAAFVTWMIVVKLFDRRRPGDDAQLLAYTVFLALAAVIVSNGLLVAVLTVVFLPLLVFAAMHLQLRLAAARADALAHRAPAEIGLPPAVRPAAGAGAGASLVRTSFVAVCVGILVAAFVFVIVPRGAGLRQLGRWAAPSAGRVVAFSERVNVGAGGVISQSHRAVMHVALRDPQDRPIGGQGSVRYLRGAALDVYDQGVWSASRDPVNAGFADEYVPGEILALSVGPDELVIRQDITLLDTPRDEFAFLFGIWRPTRLTPSDPADIAVNRDDWTIMLRTRGGKFRYSVRSSNSHASGARLGDRPPASWDSPAVAQVAADILAEIGVHPDPAARPVADDSLAVNAFRRFFWDNYTYSLGEPPPPVGVEPTEWFLTAADRGHCEHFASGLAALCRAVGIPARVVTGYVAAEYNARTQSYVIRESNAHAWVEAQSEPGVWQTYDATPPGDLVQLHAPRPTMLARAGQFLDALNYAWVNSFVSFDSGARAELLALDTPRAEKLKERADRVLEALRSASIREIVVLAAMIFSAIVSAMLLTAGAVVLGRRWRAARARRPSAIPRRVANPDARARIAALPIYQEMLTVLARAGLRKPEWQPPRDWSRSLRTAPEQPPAAPRVAPQIAELAELYYVMRFGGRDLSDEQTRRARSLLDQIRAALH